MPGAVEVDGLKTVIRQLGALDESVRAEVQDINLAAATIVQRDAYMRVPVLTGRLRATVRAAGQQSAAVVRSGGRGVPYAGPIHFGWRRHNIEPRPFLYEALDARRAEVLGVYEHRVGALLGRFDA